MNLKWHRRFLSLAQHISTWSKDPSTQTGAVIVRPDKTIASLGYNGFPRGLMDSEELLSNREEKYERILHAEVNAMLSSREKLSGYSIYVYPFQPCSRCAVMLIQSGITQVIAPKPDKERLDRWGETFARAKLMFREADIELLEIDL